MFILKPKHLTNKLKESQKPLESKFLDLQTQQILDNLKPQKDLSPKDNEFILMSYNSLLSNIGYANLGNHIQTIAAKNALESLSAKNTYNYFDLDNLNFFKPHLIGNYVGGGKYALCKAGFLTPLDSSQARIYSHFL